ncbi:MAG: hypothetical protein J6O50_09930 [Ruminiclostridium sp.]|nr:hypothetical protein [Ruminiclostridium sp.]
MLFEHGDISYEKRPLTDNIALWVISNEFPDSEEKLAAFEKLARPYKEGESASQQDACPVTRINELFGYVGFLKRTYDGFRIRNAQLSGIAAVPGVVSDVSDETASYIIASGSIAVIAGGYENGADKVLLGKGILPLVSSENYHTGTFILIKNIRSSLSGGKTEAYTVTPELLTPAAISIAGYTAEELSTVTD